jgi:hypothetical protein
MTLKQTVRHCIEKTGGTGSTEYQLEDNPNNENAAVLHASKGFLTKDFTRELRHRLIFVDATAALHDDYAMTYFLHYLELEEDTFMDNLADPVSTDEEVADFE